MPQQTPFSAGTSHRPPPPPATATGRTHDSGGVNPAAHVIKWVSEAAVIIIGRRGCCMCHVAQRLLQGQGVNPCMYEVDEEHEATVAAELSREVNGGGEVEFPAVFVGGKLFGGLERVMAAHISGELVPILKDAGALWL